MLTIGFWTGLFILIGAILCPVFTIACILFASGHWVFGIIAIIVSFLKIFK